MRRHKLNLQFLPQKEGNDGTAETNYPAERIHRSFVATRARCLERYQGLKMVKKIMLIDPHWLQLERPAIYTPPDPLGETMRELDILMQQILDRDDIASGDKARL